MLYILDKLCRITAHDGIWRYILGHHGTCCDDGILAHGHAGQDGGARTNPSVLADVDGLADKQLAVVQVMIVADELHIGGYHGMIVNGDTAS